MFFGQLSTRAFISGNECYSSSRYPGEATGSATSVLSALVCLPHPTTTFGDTHVHKGNKHKNIQIYHLKSVLIHAKQYRSKNVADVRRTVRTVPQRSVTELFEQFRKPLKPSWMDPFRHLILTRAFQTIFWSRAQKKTKQYKHPFLFD